MYVCVIEVYLSSLTILAFSISHCFVHYDEPIRAHMFCALLYTRAKALAAAAAAAAVALNDKIRNKKKKKKNRLDVLKSHRN